MYFQFFSYSSVNWWVPTLKRLADPNELKSVCSVPKLRCVHMMILIGGSLWSARVGLVLSVAWGSAGLVTGHRSVRYAGPFPSSFSYDASSGSVKQSWETGGLLGRKVLLPPRGVPWDHFYSVKWCEKKYYSKPFQATQKEKKHYEELVFKNYIVWRTKTIFV